MDNETDKDDSENPYSKEYEPEIPTPPNKNHGGSVILAIFVICYVGYELWFQWDFKGNEKVQIAIFSLVILFFLLAWVFSSISAFLNRKWGKTGSWIALFLGLLFMLVTSYYFSPEARHEKWAKPFHKHIKEYLAIVPVDQEDEPDILIGKVVIIELDRTANSPSIKSDKLQRKLRADLPEEVTTLILLKWGEKKLPIKEKSIVETCQMTAIHIPTKEITAEKYFQAEWRKVNDKTRGMVWSGYLEDTKIYQYIRRLPSR